MIPPNLRTVIVPRLSYSDSIFAVVGYAGDFPPDELLTRLKAALGYWRNTPDGDLAWECSLHDFNVGDLGNYVPAEPGSELERLLQTQGITYLDVTCLSDAAGDTDWHYDEVLLSD